MRSHILTIGALLIAAMSVNPGTAGDEKKPVKPTQRWGGKVGEVEKQKAAPKAGYLTSQDSFEKLWEAWGLKDKAPKLDFKKQIVFVQIASGPNNIGTRYILDDKGKLTAQSMQTLIAGPGFGYGIDVLERQGIKSYQGKDIE